MSPRRRGSLALRMALLTTAIAVITALIAGGLSVQLIKRNSDSAAQKSLANVADAAQAEANAGQNAAAGQLRARATLRALKIQFVPVNSKGVIQGGTGGALARAALTPEDISSLLAGNSLSATRTVGGVKVLLEGRPTDDGGARSRATAGRCHRAERRGDQTIGARPGHRGRRGDLDRPARGLAPGPTAATHGPGRARSGRWSPRRRRRSRRDRRRWPRLGRPSTSSPRTWPTPRPGNASSCCRCRMTCAPRSPPSAATPNRSPTAWSRGDDAPRVGAVMLAETQRLERLVADLLDLARLDAREFRIDLADVDAGVDPRVGRAGVVEPLRASRRAVRPRAARSRR